MTRVKTSLLDYLLMCLQNDGGVTSSLDPDQTSRTALFVQTCLSGYSKDPHQTAHAFDLGIPLMPELPFLIPCLN